MRSTDAWLPLSSTKTALRSIPAIVAGDSLPLALDLGSQSALWLPNSLLASATFQNRPRSNWISAGINGPIVYPVSTLPELRIGEAEFRDVPVGFMEPIEDQHLGLLGLPVLSRFLATYDFGGGRVALKPRSSAVLTPFQRDLSGVALAYRGDVFEIVHVASGSPAERAGLKIGRHITAIQGRRVSAENQQALGKLRQGRAGSTLVLEDSHGQTFDLVLQRYF